MVEHLLYHGKCSIVNSIPIGRTRTTFKLRNVMKYNVSLLF